MSTKFCLVCGKKAGLRCGSCAGSIDLFFCSKEHQKLAWPAHKLVCGERAHPFRFPPFSQTEADAAMEMLTSETANSNQSVTQSDLKASLDFWVKRCGSARGIDRQEVIQRLVGKDSVLIVLEGLTAFHELLIRQIRLSFGAWNDRLPNRPRNDRIITTFHVIYTQLTANAAAPSPSSLWHSKLCHIWMTVVGLIEQAEEDGTIGELDPAQAGCTNNVNLHLVSAVTSAERAFAAVVQEHLRVAAARVDA